MKIEGRPAEDGMAKVERNVLVRGIGGQVGEVVFRQMAGEETWLRGIPGFSHRVPNQEQTDHQDRFQEAVAYARATSKKQPMYAELVTWTVRSSYNWAVSDWFHPPVIRSIERSDGVVRVNATHNVMVAKAILTFRATY